MKPGEIILLGPHETLVWCSPPASEQLWLPFVEPEWQLAISNAQMQAHYYVLVSPSLKQKLMSSLVECWVLLWNWWQTLASPKSSKTDNSTHTF